MPFLAFLLGPVGRYLLIGVAALAALGGLYYKVHHAGYEEGHAELVKYRSEETALAEEQKKRIAKIESDQNAAKDANNAEHTKALQDITARYNAYIVGLRNAKPRTYAMPQTAATSTSPATACYDTDILNRGLADADRYLSEQGAGIVQRGEVAQGELKLAQSWALTITR